MNSAPANEYIGVLQTTLKRLVDHIRLAADDGTYAVGEAAQLHAWVRAELLPWAADSVRTLDVRARNEVAPAFVELAALDAELLGTAGQPAAALAAQLEASAGELLIVLDRVVTLPAQRGATDNS